MDQGRLDLYEELNQLILKNGVRNTSGPTYTTLDPSGTKSISGKTVVTKWQSFYPGIAVMVTVEGEYQNVRHFIRDVERSKQFVVINEVELQRASQNNAPASLEEGGGGAGSGTRASLVTLQLNMATYFQRPGAEGSSGITTMQLVDLSKPGEKKKLILAALLGLGAILVLYWALFGFGSSTRPPTRATASPTPQQRNTVGTRPQQAPVAEVQNLATFAPVLYVPSSYSAPEARRNIFAYYEPPPKPVTVPSTPTPTPEPPPPVLLASVSPSNVYARTADFKLEAAGDKFTPAMRIFVDGRELPTTYKGPQQLSTTIGASFIAAPGTRSVVVRTPDNSLYSNPLSIQVAAPPMPNYNYVGIISPQNRVTDTALVQDKNNKNILTVYRGDILSGRFRVTSISEKELVLTDTSLKIKHTIAMSESDKGGGPLSRPTPRVDSEDDEP